MGRRHVYRGFRGRYPPHPSCPRPPTGKTPGIHPCRPGRHPMPRSPSTAPGGRLQQAPHPQAVAKAAGHSRDRGGQGRLHKEGQECEITAPRSCQPTRWVNQSNPEETRHGWTDDSYRQSAGLGWLITSDDQGTGLAIAQGAKSLGTRQTAFDAEVVAIRTVLEWFNQDDPEPSHWKYMVIHRLPKRHRPCWPHRGWTGTGRCPGYRPACQ